MNASALFETPTDCPYYLVSRLSLQITTALRKTFTSAGIGRVKPSYLGVLWSLWLKDGVKTSELGRSAGLEPSTMTGLLDRMERDGLVMRKPDPSDRRAQVIWLTDRGTKLKGVATRMVNETMSRVFRTFNNDEMGQLTDMLKQALANAHEGNE